MLLAELQVLDVGEIEKADRLGFAVALSVELRIRAEVLVAGKILVNIMAIYLLTSLAWWNVDNSGRDTRFATMLPPAKRVVAKIR